MEEFKGVASRTRTTRDALLDVSLTVLYLYRITYNTPPDTAHLN